MSFKVNASVRNHSETFATSQHNFLIGLCDLGISACYSNCELSVSVRSINQAGVGEPASITVPIQPFSCDGAEHGSNYVISVCIIQAARVFVFISEEHKIENSATRPQACEVLPQAPPPPIV